MNCPCCGGPLPDGVAYCSPGCRYHVGRFLGDDYVRDREREASGPFEPYDVTCARCGKVGPCTEFVAEEGDEWECKECNERENAREAAISAGETTMNETEP